LCQNTILQQMKQNKVSELIDKLDPTKIYCCQCKKYKDGCRSCIISSTKLLPVGVQHPTEHKCLCFDCMKKTYDIR